jgi:hypothetical protein
MDQPPILSPLRIAISQTPMGATSTRIGGSLVNRAYIWSRNKNRAASARDSTKRCRSKRDWFTPAGQFNRCARRLPLRCTDKKRNAVFAASTWAGSMLATQRTAGDAAVGEAEGKRMKQ